MSFSMKLLSLNFCLLGLWNGSAYSAVLNPFPDVPVFSFDPNVEPSLPNCQEVLARLKSFQAINEEAHYGLADFTSTSAQRLTEWYDQLSPLEGQKADLPQGTFHVLKDGAAQMGELTEMAFQNANYLSMDLASIVEALETCLPQNSHGKRNK